MKPPVELPPDHALLWILLLAGIALAVFFLLRYLRKPGGKSGPSIARKSSWERAIDRLEELKSNNPAAPDEVKAYYTELSDIIRRYLEERFGLRAPEMTTPEFLRSLQETPQLSSGQQESLRDFLNACDMVKFAKHPAGTREMEGAWLLARRLIEETKGGELT